MISDNSPQEPQQPPPPLVICKLDAYIASDNRIVNVFTPIDGQPVRYVGMVKGAEVQVINHPKHTIDFQFPIPDAVSVEDAFAKFMALAGAEFDKIVKDIQQLAGKANSKIVIAQPMPKVPTGDGRLRIAR